MNPPNIAYFAAIGPLSWLEAALILAVAIMGMMLWRLTRHEQCHFTGSPNRPILESLPALAGSTHGYLAEGNSVGLIQDAAYFDEIERAIAEARASVSFETFLWKEGKAGTRVADALSAAARRGVRVRVLMDAGGSIGVVKATVERMEAAGCTVRRFHRWKLRNIGRLNIRDHRKIVVIDGKVAFVGGHCVTDEWLTGGEKLPRYRDITARISGPAVASIQSCFLENWTEVTDELFTDDSTFPQLLPAGDVTVHAAYVKADRCPSGVQVLHHLCIGYARNSIRIQNPYFLPDPFGVEALVNAVKRGVDVRVMLPALSATDSPMISRAGRYQFRKLLEGGVRIFEYQKTLLHQKTITVDGVWCGVGSSNFDDRSFEINDEITVGIADSAITEELDRIFERDALECTEISLDQWRKRSLPTRLLDRFLYLFAEQF